MVQVLLHLAQVLLAAGLNVAVYVGLLAALVVGIGIFHAATGCPLVVIRPFVGVVEIALLRVNLVKCHQSLVIYGTSPEVAGADFLYECVESRVAVLRHEVVVGAIGYFQNFILQCALGRNRSQTQEHEER